MSNRHGYPIWYELMTRDPDASKAFYDTVMGWTVEAQPSGDMDYRMIDTGNGLVGGVLKLSEKDCEGGAFPTWLFYIGVDDVDATAAKIAELGGAIHLQPFDIPDVGRVAMAGDPQGNPFYIMRGSSDEESTAFEPVGMGKCNWNELATRDHAAGNAFYSDVFGWTWPDKMEMPGDMGDYTFAAAGDVTIGATMKVQQDGKAGWQFYFRAPDINAAADKVKAGGGQVLQDPMEVPGGDMIIIATDPEGVRFGVVAPGQ